MPLEEEVIGLLIGGFSIIMGIALLTVLFLCIKIKEIVQPIFGQYCTFYFSLLLHTLL
ncbi:hypothetical protein WAX74_16860 [Psychrobacillus sp. FJAT-51614]|uniref:Uncharacterized protein n=1 Tax=Psychrobacillus mangrovi TaxID=3117745 RepID=A0ABU8F8G8_9BACI